MDKKLREFFRKNHFKAGEVEKIMEHHVIFPDEWLLLEKDVKQFLQGNAKSNNLERKP